MAKLTTEESITELALLRTQILARRAEGLRESAEIKQKRLAERARALEALRGQIKQLKRLSVALPVQSSRAQSSRRAASLAAPVRVKEAAMDSARAAATSLRPTGRIRWAPILVLLICALLFDAVGRWRGASSSFDASRLVRMSPLPHAQRANAPANVEPLDHNSEPTSANPLAAR